MVFEAPNQQPHLTTSSFSLSLSLLTKSCQSEGVDLCKIPINKQYHCFWRIPTKGQNRKLTMSRRNGGGGGPKLDLKLNLSPPRPHRLMIESPNHSTTLTMSPTSSCLSSELAQDETGLRYPTSPEVTSMMLVGCPRCLMYIMLAEDYPKCPKCKSTVLLDVVHDNVKKTKNS